MSKNPTYEEAADRSDLLALSATLRARARKGRAKKVPSKLVGSGRLVGRRCATKLKCINCGKRASLTRASLGGWTVKPTCECNPAAQIEVGCSRAKALQYFAPAEAPSNTEVRQAPAGALSGPSG